VLSDDDGAGDLDSQLTVSFPEDGTYVVVASSLSGGSTGSYTLSVDEPIDMRDLPTEGRSLSIGEEVSGFLTSDDPVVEPGRRGQAWELDVPEGQSLTIELSSDDFDCFLYLIGPGLSDPITDDDGAGNLDSRITFTFPMDGTYLVIASALSAGEGRYTLRVGETLGMHELPTEGRSAEVGGTMTGYLSESDPIVDDNRHGQAWALEGRAGDVYTVELMSDDFDSYLYLVGPGITDPRTDDDGGEGLNSRLTVTLPEDGSYRVVVSCLSPSGTGEYSLRVTGHGS
jgi:serine protease Do